MKLMLSCWLLLSAAPGWADDARLRVSSGFGARSDPLHGRRAVHRGIDLPGRHGTPVLAAAAGRVRAAGRRGGYGRLVELVHADGGVTRYAHLAHIVVREGEIVAQGQPIGTMGSTGRSTGTHLHFEYRIGGEAVDPMRYFRRDEMKPTHHFRRHPRAGGDPYSQRLAHQSPTFASMDPRLRGDDGKDDPSRPAPTHRSRFANMRDAKSGAAPSRLPGGRDALRTLRR